MVQTLKARMRGSSSLSLSDKSLEVLRKMVSVGAYEYLGCARPRSGREHDHDVQQPPSWRRSSAREAMLSAAVKV